MKPVIRISSLLISALLLASCAGEETNTPTTTDIPDSEAVTEAPARYTLPEYDFGGEAVNIISTDYETCSTLVAGETGDILNDAKYAMQRTVEEAFNITLSEDTSTGHWDMNTHIQSLIMAGDTTFDIVSMMDYFAVPVAMENIFLPIGSLDGIHLDAPYWSSFGEQLQIAGNQYFAPVSCSLTGFRRASCLVMNMQMASKYDLEIPYDDVRAGTWTWDDLHALRGIATQDLNGDGTFDANDQYTFDTTDMRHMPITAWIGCDLDFIVPDENGYPAVTVYDSEKFVDVFDMAKSFVCSENNDLRFGCSSSTNMYDTGLFYEGRSLIAFSQLRNLEKFRGMEDDFAILPTPKYNEAQENYRTYTYDLQYFCIPVTQEDTELSASVIDALCCVGYYDLLPVYSETVLKEKFARDENSIDMLQIIFDTRVQNLGGVYLYDYFGDQYIFNELMEKDASISTKLESQRKKMDNKLKKITEAFLDMNS